MGESEGKPAAVLVHLYQALSLRRLERNPMRILDSKDEADKAINVNAPSLSDYLNTASRDFFAAVKAGLEASGIEFVVDPALVRGLDYYTHTAFEFVTTHLGAQGTVIGGGRYDGLVEVMGGPAMPGVGWAAGIERLALLIDDPPASSRPIALVPLGEAAEQLALKLAEDLRDTGLAVDLGYSGNLARRMRRADRLGARAAVLIGENELAQGAATVRDFDSGAQELVPLGELAARLKALVGSGIS